MQSKSIDTQLMIANVMAMEFNLEHTMISHALLCIAGGFGLMFLPHSFYEVQNWRGQTMYDHVAHEFLRMYGALTIAIGWFVWRTRHINDARLKRIVCETFALCYPLQALIMIRAQFTNPDGHSQLHWVVACLFLIIGGAYAFMRFVKKIKDFSLPGSSHDKDF
jgi:hypothetical protein